MDRLLTANGMESDSFTGPDPLLGAMATLSHWSLCPQDQMRATIDARA